MMRLFLFTNCFWTRQGKSLPAKRNKKETNPYTHENTEKTHLKF